MDTAIDAAHIGRRFGEIVALDDVSFSIARSAVFGLLGPNGAGKTTAVRILNGVIAPTKAGHIHILGLDLARDTQSIRQKVGVLTDTDLYERLTALDNLQLFGMLYDMTRDEARVRSDSLLSQFDLAERAYDRVETFSKGMKQKLSIARALIGDPELIYLDEPTAGLDPETSYELLQYIKTVSSDSSKTFFITSHRLEEMESICTDVAILARGRIKAFGSPSELAQTVITEHWVTVKLGRTERPEVHELKRELPFVLDARVADGSARVRVPAPDAIPELVRYLVGRGVDVYRVAEDVPTLKDAYLALVHEEER